MKRLLMTLGAFVLSVTAAFAQPASFGTITAAAQTVEAAASPGVGSLGVQVSGTWVGTLTFQATTDGTNYVSVLATSATAGTSATTTTANGVFSIGNPGFSSIRVNATAWTSGTANVVWVRGTAGGSGGGAGGGGAVTQGTIPWVVSNAGTFAVQAAQSGAWTVQPGNTANTTPWLVAPPTGSFASDVVFGTATYTEGTTSGPAAAVRNDTPDALVNTTNEIGPLGTAANGGVWTALASDPCSYLTKTVIVVNIASATTTELTPSLAGASNYYYVCGINLGPTSAAQNFALVDDDSDNCGSVTSGMAGGTTSGTGWNIAANGGLAFGNGLGTIFKTNGTNRVICAVTSSTGQTSGSITVVAAP